MLVFSAWLVAALATGGALFLSEIMNIAPCVLCWYQRIFMFPLVLVLAMGLFPLDTRVVRYALPLAIGGCAGGRLSAAAHGRRTSPSPRCPADRASTARRRRSNGSAS